MTMRGGMQTPYKVFKVPISKLSAMDGFREQLQDIARSKAIDLRLLTGSA